MSNFFILPLMSDNYGMHWRKDQHSRHAILGYVRPHNKSKVGATLVRLLLKVAFVVRGVSLSLHHTHFLGMQGMPSQGESPYSGDHHTNRRDGAMLCYVHYRGVSVVWNKLIVEKSVSYAYSTKGL